MLNHISWSSFWTTITIILICYYAYIAWINRTGILKYKPVTTAELPSSDVLLHPQAEACNNELSAYLEQVALTKPSKKEILFSVHKIIQRYPTLPGTVYQDAINKWIAFDAKDKCAIHLNDEELKEVWMVQVNAPAPTYPVR